MELTIINPLNHPAWDDLVVSSGDYSFFHSSAWARVISESYNYKPLYFSLVSENRLMAGIPVMEIRSFLTGLRGVSLPFSDYCEPIVSKELPLRDALERIISYGKRAGWRLIEIRGGRYPADGTSLPLSYYYLHVLNLMQTKEVIFANLKSSTKRNIKKAVREGITVVHCSSQDSLKEFYRLNCTTRKHHGLPPQPYVFFRKIFEHIIDQGKGFIVLAFHEGKAIAGAVFFHFGKKALYKFGASDRGYLHLRPNNLVMWEAIKWYCDNGYESLSMGRTEPDNKGLKHFKSGWGTEEHIINYHKYDLIRDTYFTSPLKTNGFQNKVLMKLPLPLLKVIGNVLYRHVG